jgi:hypothetical protein
MFTEFLEWLINALTPPPPPNGMSYCPDCSGTGWTSVLGIGIMCPVCHGMGLIPKIEETNDSSMD